MFTTTTITLSTLQKKEEEEVKKLFSKKKKWQYYSNLMTIRRSEDRENNILLEKFEWQMSDRFNCCVQITDFFASFWQEMRKNQEKNWFEEMYVCILFWLLSQLAFFHWFMCQILVRDNFSAYHTQKKQEIYFKFCQIFGIQNHKSIRATPP